MTVSAYSVNCEQRKIVVDSVNIQCKLSAQTNKTRKKKMNTVNVERRRQERLEKASTALTGLWDSWGLWYDRAMEEYEAAHLAVHGYKPR